MVIERQDGRVGARRARPAELAEQVGVAPVEAVEDAHDEEEGPVRRRRARLPGTTRRAIVGALAGSHVASGTAPGAVAARRSAGAPPGARAGGGHPGRSRPRRPWKAAARPARAGPARRVATSAGVAGVTSGRSSRPASTGRRSARNARPRGGRGADHVERRASSRRNGPLAVRQGAEVGAAAEPLPEVARQRADVRAGAAATSRTPRAGPGRCRPSSTRSSGMDRHGPRGELAAVAGARQLVGAPAAHVDRRVGRAAPVRSCPRNAGQGGRDRLAVGRRAAPGVISPSMSSVVERRPEADRGAVALLVAEVVLDHARRAARGRPAGRPSANGSSVPPCPTRRTPVRRRTSATMSCDVGPGGLATTRMPSQPGLGAGPAPRRQAARTPASEPLGLGAGPARRRGVERRSMVAPAAAHARPRRRRR